VLLVDDDRTTLMLTSRLLTKAGADVTPLSDGDQIWKAIQAANAAGAPFDILFTDRQMGRVHGDDAVRVLREAGVDMPAIAVTGEGVDDDALFDAGFDEVIHKPMTYLRVRMAFILSYMPIIWLDLCRLSPPWTDGAEARPMNE
jgi:CheY-like chemotaxis protein